MPPPPPPQPEDPLFRPAKWDWTPFIVGFTTGALFVAIVGTLPHIQVIVR